MNYKEAIEYLFSQVPMFQNVGGAAYKEGLANTLALDARFNHPHRKYRSIHVAGTNGKGSVAHTLAAILQTAGYKTGLYTSPHLIDFRERIRVNGKMISECAVIDFIEKERVFFEPLHPSFFELTTALAFKYFAEQEVDIAVIEVGMGGRLDCTNIISPLISIITNISLDHVQYLGHTTAQIAREKAGIIKPRTPVIVGETTKETRAVFVAEAKRNNAPIRFADETHEVLSSTQFDGYRFYKTRHGEIKGQLCGSFQDKNTATILTATDALAETGIHLDNNLIASGFANVCRLTGLRARWQKLSSHPSIICDTGHNPGAIRYIGEQLRLLPAKKLYIIIGMASDKDISGVLRLMPRTANYFFTKASVKRALDEHKLKELAQKEGLRGEVFPDVRSAFGAAREKATTEDAIFVGGSTFVVADFLRVFTY